jgi:sulfite exporter TauE/SafE
MNEAILVSAFTMGLMGAGHCVGMCGGIATALSFGARQASQRSTLAMLPIVSAYNVGRLSSYVLAGALFGWIGSIGWSLLTPDDAVRYSRYVGFGFMVALGLYLMGWWQGLAYLERLGSRIWQYIEPLGRRFLPVQRPDQAAVVGLVWGWLPCGMVYTGLSWALASGGPLQGAYIMLAFGAGTLPALMTMGLGGSWLSGWLKNRSIRTAAGVMVLVLAGILLVYQPGHHHHGDQASEAQEASQQVLSI